MTNGGTPKIEGPEDVYAWAMHHEAVIAEKWRHQDGLNARMECEMSGLRKRITAVEIRVAVFAAIFGGLGGLVGACLPAIIAAAR
jgi:hypothetical protein